MKPVRTLCIPFLLIFGCMVCCMLPKTMKAQCAGISQSITYDTLVTGTGNDNFSFSVPQFNPALGTLASVDIKTIVSIGYGFQIENITNSSRSVMLGVGRNDYLGSAALAGSYFANYVQKDYGPFSLGAQDAVPNSGGDYLAQGPFSFLNKYTVLNDSITTQVVDFMGNGNVSFDYYPSTYSIIPANLTYTFSANDTIHFLVTYHYCNPIILPVDITSFSAARENKTIIKLAWSTENEKSGRNYDIQKSADGNNFTGVGSMPSAPGNNTSADYQYHYPIADADKGKIYFRLKIIDADGEISYSQVRELPLNESATGFYLYPNPSDRFINVVFNEPASTDWQVDIYAAHGGLIQRNFFFNVNSARVIFGDRLAAGVYFLRATDRQTLKSHVSSFVVN